MKNGTDTIQVSGTLEAVAWLDGASGRFSGDIRGLYEAYRVGTPPVQTGSLDLAHGRLALEVRHEWHLPMPPRAPQNPFAQGKAIHDLAEERNARIKARIGERPGKLDDSAFQGRYKTTITLRVDPTNSSGIFAGATGEMNVEAPAHRESGYMVVTTDDGNLQLNFLESAEGMHIVAELSVDGVNSTGIYQQAEGTVRFKMARVGIGVGQGTYSGVLHLLRPLSHAAF